LFSFKEPVEKWKGPFPDSLISSNAIFVVDKESGKILNSWGANLFIMPHGLTVDNDDNIWVTDVALQQVFKFSHDGTVINEN
jgi:peptidylamidoglycolate lyase